MGWLVRGATVLASFDAPSDRTAKRQGLLGKRSYDGALLLSSVRSVHTFGMRMTIDVAFLDASNTVTGTTAMRPWRISRPRRGVASILEAEHGAFVRWNLRVGDQLEFRT
jgi:uncharacterized membrane protein (UPF0127 family)